MAHRTTRNPPPITSMRGAVEFWTEGEVPTPTALLLDSLRPKPHRLLGDEVYPLTGLPMGIRRWRVEVGRRTTSKQACLAALAKWAAAHHKQIRAARRAGLSCEAHIELAVEHWRYELPIATDHARAVQNAGLELHVVFCRCGATN